MSSKRPTRSRRPLPDRIPVPEALLPDLLAAQALARTEEGRRYLRVADELRSVRPTGGARTALGGYFREAKRYLAELERLRKEGWF